MRLTLADDHFAARCEMDAGYALPELRDNEGESNLVTSLIRAGIASEIRDRVNWDDLRSQKTSKEPSDPVEAATCLVPLLKVREAVAESIKEGGHAPSEESSLSDLPDSAVSVSGGSHDADKDADKYGGGDNDRFRSRYVVSAGVPPTQ